MHRREFVRAGVAAAALSPDGARAADGEAQVKDDTKATAASRILELRRYRLRFGAGQTRYAEYAKGVLLPALNRAGVKPVGAFTILVGPESPSVYLLLSHPNAESVWSAPSRLAADPEYAKAAEPFRTLPATDPLYVGRESALMIPFDTMPDVEVPAGLGTAASRIFELRIYSSHNEAAGRKKIEMFEKAGEIAIFRRVGLNPVFFARNVTGPVLPSLTYMLAFADVGAREKAWSVFREDPEWTKLSTTPGYTNAEILTTTSNWLLRPTDYSQI
jgi:NIPSNAP